MQLEKFGIRLDIPQNALAPDQRQLISLTVITDLTPLTQYIEHDDQDGFFAAFGIQCEPSGFEFNAPITVTIPHCIDSASSGSVIPVLYSSAETTGICCRLTC